MRLYSFDNIYLENYENLNLTFAHTKMVIFFTKLMITKIKQVAVVTWIAKVFHGSNFFFFKDNLKLEAGADKFIL